MNNAKLKCIVLNFPAASTQFPTSSVSPPVYSYFEKGCRRKMCTRQSRKVTWDMINTLFLTLQLSNLVLLLSFSTFKCKSMASPAILQISLKNSELKTTHNTFRDCRVHFFRQPFSKQLYGKNKGQGFLTVYEAMSSRQIRETRASDPERDLNLGTPN